MTSQLVRSGRAKKSKADASEGTRDRLLRAAEEVVISEGAQALTLDAVYKRAGVSKGGLLYHFPSKEALLDGMIERYIARSQSAEQAVLEGHDPFARGAKSRASIALMTRQNSEEDKIGAALLAAVATDLDRLAPVRLMIQERFDELKKNPMNFDVAAIIEFAITGLSLLELLKISPLSPRERKRFLMALREMTDHQRCEP